MKFRSHKGTLAESMDTVKEVKDLNDVKKILEKEYEPYKILPGEITCKYYCYDKRINWDSWIILENGYAIGFSDGQLFGYSTNT